MAEIKGHGKNVEKFYTLGSKRVQENGKVINPLDEGFLSFGYWEQGDDYPTAAKRLLKYFIDNSGIKKAEKILNVACGYGSESFVYFKRFKPKQIVGIDITEAHVDYANRRAAKEKLSKKIHFIHADAVKLDKFADNTFSHILGIEGPAHFKTRTQFFSSANRVLKKGGELMLTDIIVGKKMRRWNPFHQFLLRMGAKGWVVPMDNAVNEVQYRKQLEDAGFEIMFFKNIGDRVFPGYADSWDQIRDRDAEKKMGFFAAKGFRIIGKFLGYAYKKGLIEYIYFKARKLK